MVSSHGELTVSIEGCVITAVFRGSFNGEAIGAYSNKIKSLIEKFNGEPFAVLIDHRQFEGGTPDGFEALEKLNRWINTQRLVAKAFIITNDIHKGILLQRTPALATQNVAFFKHFDEAKQWLYQNME